MPKQVRQSRENRTITIDFQNEATYIQLLGDGKAFLECVLAFVLSVGVQLKHKATCGGGGCLTRHSHYVRARLRSCFKNPRLVVPSNLGGTRELPNSGKIKG